MFMFKGTTVEDSSKPSSKYKPSIKIPKQSVGADETTLHLLPFSIGHNGHAKVSSFFHITKDESGVQSSMFRGIRLYGTSLQLPNNYSGYVYRSDKSNDNSTLINQDVKWEVISKFNSFNYWNREKKPSVNDSIQQAMKWIDISQALFKPITKEMIEEEKNKMETDTPLNQDLQSNTTTKITEGTTTIESTTNTNKSDEKENDDSLEKECKNNEEDKEEEKEEEEEKEKEEENSRPVKRIRT